MTEQPVPKPYHRLVTIILVLINLIAIGYAIYEGQPGERDYHFREESFIIWLGSAQMIGAALLFFASFLAVNIIRLEGARRDSYTWLIFAVGFFILALDQQFRLREHLTVMFDGGLPGPNQSSSTVLVLKAIPTGLAMALVFFCRSTVLANFRMVISFAAGFWFLICMLLVTMLFESVGVSASAAKIASGSAMLLAMAMFLSASYAALLDRIWAAHTAMQLMEGQMERGKQKQAVKKRQRLTMRRRQLELRKALAQAEAEGDQDQAHEEAADDAGPGDAPEPKPPEPEVTPEPDDPEREDAGEVEDPEPDGSDAPQETEQEPLDPEAPKVSRTMGPRDKED